MPCADAFSWTRSPETMENEAGGVVITGAVPVPERVSVAAALVTEPAEVVTTTS